MNEIFRSFRVFRVQNKSILVFEKIFVTLRLCVCDSHVPPLQIPTKVDASPIFRLFYEREQERFRSELEAN